MRLQRLSLGVSLAFSISFIVRHIKNVRNYKISQCLCSDSKLNSIVNKVNDENILIPSKPQKIQPPKPDYIRQSYTYQYDVNDTFYYDTILTQSSKPAVVIVPFICGHSKSSCIRRLAQQFYENDHSVYILLPRGSLDTKLSLQQKKLRYEGIDSEDLNQLIGLIPNKSVILAGYSLGALNTCHYMSKNSDYISNRNKVVKAIMCFVEFDDKYALQIPARVQRYLGKPIVSYVTQNKEYFNKHGISLNAIDKITSASTIYQYDQEVTCKIRNHSSPAEYYEWIFTDVLQFNKLSVPCLFVQTEDDVITGSFVPYDQMKGNENINVVVFNRGNHLGTVTSDGKDLVSRVVQEWCE
ncbi:Conserved_hypothetical protein [Hexamita inflata]|uniref:Uncharacterized protein n=1 Tax=Hexamita inflata TaxID=28002 RepID=A0AA86RGU8_9EUKA|nr:Conserved hypothetical protein [Hexamita inflata]